MRNLVVMTLAGGLFSGCIIYEEELVDREDPPDRGELPGETDEVATFDLWLNPAGGLAGDTAIVSLLGQGDVDLNTIESIRFFGDGAIEILATDTRSANEFLLTIAIPQSAVLGPNDLLVEFTDGSAAFVEGAFEVVADESEIPDSGDGGDSGDGSGGDGSGDGSGCP